MSFVGSSMLLPAVGDDEYQDHQVMEETLGLLGGDASNRDKSDLSSAMFKGYGSMSAAAAADSSGSGDDMAKKGLDYYYYSQQPRDDADHLPNNNLYQTSKLHYPEEESSSLAESNGNNGDYHRHHHQQPKVDPLFTPPLSAYYNHLYYSNYVDSNQQANQQIPPSSVLNNKNSSEDSQQRKQQNQRARLGYLLASATVLLLIGLMIDAIHHHEEQQQAHSHRYRTIEDSGNIAAMSEEQLFEERSTSSSTYQYLVVGGGPSGIIVATKLAEYLWKDHERANAAAAKASVSATTSSSSNAHHRPRPHPEELSDTTTTASYYAYAEKPKPVPRVLLLESGTVSQSAVEENVPLHQAQEQHQRERDEEGERMKRKRNTKSSTSDENERIGASIVSGTAAERLNKFDIPLLWSADAASHYQQQAGSGSESYATKGTTASASSSYFQWPITKTLLARALGGCGILNAMIYIRAIPQDIVEWDLPGWTWETMERHYVQLETYLGKHVGVASRQQHQKAGRRSGYHGPMATSTTVWKDLIAPLFVASAEAAGLPFMDSFNDNEDSVRIASDGVYRNQNKKKSVANERMGVGYYEFNIRNGLRDSVAQALLGRDLSSIPKNLDIRTGATVQRILFDTEIEQIMSKKEKKQRTRRKHGNKNGDTAKETSSNHSRPKAVGVEYWLEEQIVVEEDETAPKMETIRALKTEWLTMDDDDRAAEVILAAGAIMSPQLLWSSGIGPNGQIVDLPGVGQNLQDHPVVAMAFGLTTDQEAKASSIYEIPEQLQDYEETVQHLLIKEEQLRSDPQRHKLGSDQNWTAVEESQMQLGVLGTPGFSAGAFLQSPYAAGGVPDLQLTVFPRVLEPHVKRRSHNEHILSASAPTGDALSMKNSMLVTVALLRPEARYQVRPYGTTPLTSDAQSEERALSEGDDAILMRPILEGASAAGDPTTRTLPCIALAGNRTTYLTEHDIDRLKWGMEEVRRILQQPPLRDATTIEVFPGAPVVSDALRNHIRMRHLPNSHWAGSTKMGRDDDEMAVVDTQLRVRGIENVRVVDAGVMPKVPNGNTHSTVCVIASHAADMIFAGR